MFGIRNRLTFDYPKLTLLTLAALLVACQPDSDQSSDSTTASQDMVSAPMIRDSAPYLSQDYAAMRKQQIKSVDYSLSIELDHNNDRFRGTNLIDFELAEDNISPITLDFDSGELEQVLVNGTAVEADYSEWFISLPAELFKAGKNRIEIKYNRRYATDGSGLHRFQDPETNEVYLYTDFEPYDANRMFPHFDQPNLKARYTLDVLAPPDWQIISTSRESEIRDAGDRKHWFFPQTAIISSYVFSLHAGPYHVWEDTAGEIPLRLFARQSIAPYVKTDDWFKPTKQSFAFFQQYFDIPYPFVKYDQVIVPDFNSGAMENAAAVTFNERYVSRGEKTTAQRQRLANVIAHEMAHMWFGDLVTMDWWNGLWLNESFATYMANLELSQASDFENVWDSFYSGSKQWGYDTDQQVTTHPIEVPVPNTADGFSNFDGITYGKGASVLKQLPYYLGEEAFREGVRNYLKKYAYQNTSLDDFISELAKASGRDLDQWAQQWLYQAGLNTIMADYQCTDGKVSAMTLKQSAPKAWPTLREQRVQIGLYREQNGSMTAQRLIPITYSGATTTVADAIDADCPDLVYPNVDDWGYVKVAFDPRSLATLKKSINAFEQPGLRLMLWQNLWDSVQDIQLPLDRYVDFALGNIGQEEDLNVVRQVASTIASAFNYLTEIDAEAYQAQRQAIADFSWQQLRSADPGSDLQKVWFDHFANLAHSQDGLNRLARLLSGDLQLQGLTLDQDKRWEIVIQLNRHQFGDYRTLLEKEKQRDPSDQGQKMAIAAEVIRPDAETKARWLDIILATPGSQNPQYKLASLRVAMGALFPSDQRALLQPHSERLLGAVPRLNESADLGFMRAYSGSLSTASCSNESVRRLAKAKEDFADFNATLSKAYKISHQADQRCVAMAQLMISEAQ